MKRRKKDCERWVVERKERRNGKKGGGWRERILGRKGREERSLEIRVEEKGGKDGEKKGWRKMRRAGRRGMEEKGQ